MQAHHQLTIWLVVLTGFLLAGCGEVLNEFYLSNHTEAALTVRLTPLHLETVDLSAGPLIEDVQNSVRSSLGEPVTVEHQGESLQFIVPPRTTVFLGISSGGNLLFSQLDVRADTVQLTMTESNYKEHFVVHDNFIGAVIHVLNVK